jgi:hypothetical protein
MDIQKRQAEIKRIEAVASQMAQEVRRAELENDLLEIVVARKRREFQQEYPDHSFISNTSWTCTEHI